MSKSSTTHSFSTCGPFSLTRFLPFVDKLTCSLPRAWVHPLACSLFASSVHAVCAVRCAFVFTSGVLALVAFGRGQLIDARMRYAQCENERLEGKRHARQLKETIYQVRGEHLSERKGGRERGQ
eukprot:1172798-Rhodomonas_salina.2